MEYVTPIDCGGSDPERAYEDGCRATGQLGSLTPARFYNLMLAEGRNLVEGAGLTLDPNNDAQWLEAVQSLITALQPAPRWLLLEEGSAQSIEPSVGTTITNLSVTSSNLIDTVVTSSGFIVGAQDAGVWSITARANVGGGVRENVAILVNGVSVMSQLLDGQSQVPSTAVIYPLNAGDEIVLQFDHLDSDTRVTTGHNILSAARISAF